MRSGDWWPRAVFSESKKEKGEETGDRDIKDNSMELGYTRGPRSWTTAERGLRVSE